MARWGGSLPLFPDSEAGRGHNGKLLMNDTSTPGASSQWGRGRAVASLLSLPFSAWKHPLRWGKDPRGPSLANMLCPFPEWGLGRRELQPLTCNCLGCSLINQQLQAGWESLTSCSFWKKAFLRGARKRGPCVWKSLLCSTERGESRRSLDSNTTELLIEA